MFPQFCFPAEIGVVQGSPIAGTAVTVGAVHTRTQHHRGGLALGQGWFVTGTELLILWLLLTPSFFSPCLSPSFSDAETEIPL